MCLAEATGQWCKFTDLLNLVNKLLIHVQYTNVQMEPKHVNTSTGKLETMGNHGIKNQDSFGRWMNYTMTNSLEIADPNLIFGSLVLAG